MADEIGVCSPELMRAMVEDFRRRQQLAPQISQNYPQRRLIDQPSPHRVFVKNTEEEVIPPYACLRVLGTVETGGRTALSVEKPTDVTGEFVFNGPYEIPALADVGVGWAYKYDIIVMLGDGTPPTAANVQYTPVVGSWEITEGAGPFVVFGEHSVVTDALIGRIGVAGPTIRHAVVASVLEGGYYTVTLGTWSGDKSTVCDDIGDDDCNICANLDLESAECGQLLLEYPPSQVTAGATTVTAYSSTWRLIPLLVGSDCKVINMGDIDADETTEIWQILSGLPEHVIKYTEEWSCCDGEGESGVPTLLTRQATILIGHDCDPVTCDNCDP